MPVYYWNFKLFWFPLFSLFCSVLYPLRERLLPSLKMLREVALCRLHVAVLETAGARPAEWVAAASDVSYLQ